ncbi:hypothetical protein Hypma_006722 [Hypsizygus marmoreus]|uniref:Uncharacterized protein n=1 Tax=Hypsizygus marmoreus TaxID=39966 RepID=A0A369K2B4_HYPMA|nr:hypothetical protein Hypma_006722 [Hypsizygus marmoreus]
MLSRGTPEVPKGAGTLSASRLRRILNFNRVALPSPELGVSRSTLRLQISFFAHFCLADRPSKSGAQFLFEASHIMWRFMSCAGQAPSNYTDDLGMYTDFRMEVVVRFH